MRRLNVPKKALTMALLCATLAISAPAQVFTTLVNFAGEDGYPRLMSLVQGHDGNLYGTTSYGGLQGGGQVFVMTPEGTVTTLYSFCSQPPNCSDGFSPWGGLTLATDTNFYGTTNEGGTNNSGTAFRVSSQGVLTTLHRFAGPDGLAPQTPPVQAIDGFFYWSVYDSSNGYGVIFKSTGEGDGKVLYSFCPGRRNCSQGASPTMLVPGSDGNLYGTTAMGGSDGCSQGCGTVFKITAEGTLTTLHVFCNDFNCADGTYPLGGLVRGSDGNFYGTTYGGGTNSRGTIFRITPAGKLTTLYSFCPQSDCTDGGSPEVAMIEATDGNLYGTTAFGGTSSCAGAYAGCGTLFRITPTGKLTTLHSFDQTDGAYPNGLTQATSGTFYGTTLSYGQMSGGTVFSLDMGLGPFISFVRAIGKVGQTGGILGQGFTGTTSVTINGIQASFTVVSDTYITATVPAGATTGYVTVTTPSGILTSNVPFHVIP
jgi:uncharacterized repeat protein (TIGR03803 family)